MRTTKRIIAALLCLLLLLSLSGCVTRHHSALALYGDSPVASVELYDLHGAYAEELAELLSGKEEAAAPLQRLPADKTDAFLAEAQTLQYSDTVILLPVAQDPNMLFDGLTVMVTYENGNWEAFDDGFCVSCDGTRVRSNYGSTDMARWDDLLQDWFGVESKNGYRTDGE